MRFQEGNILLSDLVNSDSKILYDRTPRERVEKVAPWLTVDGDAYPAVVDGRIVWIVDGYTTSNGYPYSQRTTLGEATADALTENTRSVTALQSDQVNYIRNSVKATVDAYDGTVTSTRGTPPTRSSRPGRRRSPAPCEPLRGDPAGAAGAPALPRGPVQGAAQAARAATT